MTKKELIAELTAEYLDEVEGIKKYAQMIVDIAPCDPTGQYRKIIEGIMHDENEHQEYLMKILKDMDAFVPDPVMKAMEEVKEIMHGH